MALEFFDKIEELIPVLKQEEDNMRKAGHIVAQSIMSGGILQAFGSGHSASVAIEICGWVDDQRIPARVADDKQTIVVPDIPHLGECRSHAFDAFIMATR
jgi:hypothetical protein